MKNKQPLISIIAFHAVIACILLGFGLQNGGYNLDLLFRGAYSTLTHEDSLFILGSFLLIKSILVFCFRERLIGDNFIIIQLLIDVLLAIIFLYLIRYQGLIGVPRRYYTFDYYQLPSSFKQPNDWLNYSTLILGLNQLCFILLIAFSFFRSKRTTLRDPKLLDDDY